MSKRLEDLKNEKLRELSSGFDQNNNINVFSKCSYEEGWKDAIKAASEREKKLLNALLSYQGQVLRVYGDKIPDAFKIPYSFAEEALKDYRGMK